MKHFAIFLAFLFFSSLGHATSFKREYKMQVTVGPNTAWGMGAAYFADQVAERTQGRVHVKPYCASQLVRGAQANAAPMVSMGAIDLALDSTINMAPTLPEFNIFSLPFFIGSYEDIDQLEAGQTGKILFDALRDKGLVGLAWGENGFRWFTNSKKPVRRPEDLKGLRIRVAGSPIFIQLFRALGADPMEMNWGDAVTAFQQGGVDGQENPAEILLSVQIQQYHKHITAWDYAMDPLVFYWNRSQFEAFPEDIQEAIRGAAREAGRYQKALARSGLDQETSATILKTEFQATEVPDPLAFFPSKGAEILYLTFEERQAFVAATQHVFDRWVQKIGPDLVKTARQDMEGP